MLGSAYWKEEESANLPNPSHLPSSTALSLPSRGLTPPCSQAASEPQQQLLRKPGLTPAA